MAPSLARLTGKVQLTSCQPDLVLCEALRPWRRLAFLVFCQCVVSNLQLTRLDPKKVIERGSKERLTSQAVCDNKVQEIKSRRHFRGSPNVRRNGSCRSSDRGIQHDSKIQWDK
jgi:hypothetical protein